jgi:apolipoprotein N-acyltransferase
LLGIVLALPYVVTRTIQNHFSGFISTLVFPTTTVALYYLNSIFGPFDGVIVFYAYSQFGNFPLMQLLSIAGIWMLIFLLSWFSSVVHWLWQNDFRIERTKKGMVIFLSCAFCLLSYGGVKISPFFFDYEGSTVRVAAAVFHNAPGQPNYGIDKLLNERMFTPMQERLEQIENATKQAAAGGAKIIAFQEFSLILPEEEEQLALSELKRIAIDNDIYMSRLCIDARIIARRT